MRSAGPWLHRSRHAEGRVLRAPNHWTVSNHPGQAGPGRHPLRTGPRWGSESSDARPSAHARSADWMNRSALPLVGGRSARVNFWVMPSCRHTAPDAAKWKAGLVEAPRLLDVEVQQSPGISRAQRGTGSTGLGLFPSEPGPGSDGMQARTGLKRTHRPRSAGGRGPRRGRPAHDAEVQALACRPRRRCCASAPSSPRPASIRASACGSGTGAACT